MKSLRHSVHTSPRADAKNLIRFGDVFRTPNWMKGDATWDFWSNLHPGPRWKRRKEHLQFHHPFSKKGIHDLKHPPQRELCEPAVHLQGCIPCYCWWKKSCSTWDVWNPANNGILAISTGAEFLPSTVSPNECLETSSLKVFWNPHWISTPLQTKIPWQLQPKSPSPPKKEIVSHLFGRQAQHRKYLASTSDAVAGLRGLGCVTLGGLKQQAATSLRAPRFGGGGLTWRINSEALEIWGFQPAIF